MATMANGEFPNTVVVHMADGTERVYFLQDTRLNLIFDGFNWQLTINDMESFPESEIQRIAYEYRSSDESGIKPILDNGSAVKIYTVDGRKIASTTQSIQNAIKYLPHGAYIIQSNGKTFKIVK